MICPNIDPSILLPIVASADAALLAVTATLVTIVPSLVEIARLKSETYLSGEAARRSFIRGLAGLACTIWLFGLGTALSVLGLVYRYNWILLADLAISALALIVLVVASYRLASRARSII